MLDSSLKPPSLAYLVEHEEAIDADLSVDAALTRFRAHSYEYAAAIADNQVIGMVSRSHLVGLVSGRYGFALHSRAPVRHHMVDAPLIVEASLPLGDLLARALSRSEDAFYRDVALVGQEGNLIGLVSTQRLVSAQSGIVGQQVQQLETQRLALESANAELENSLHQQRELERQVVAREKTELIETLVGGIAHEINNKLTPIVGFTELLRVGDEQFEDYCRMIHDAALDASRIIRQLLQLSRPNATEHIVCDLRQTVEQSLTLLQLRLKEADIDLEVSLPADAALVTVDAVQIKQLLMNLALNAVDAMEGAVRRRLTVAVKLVLPMAVVDVSDTGIGIPQDRIHKIFDPFYTTKAPNRGTGLGLSVCYSIVQLHGGTISVDSVPGRGTTFRVKLPVAGMPVPRRAEPVSGAGPKSYDGLRVLVVEDDDAVAALLVRVFERQMACDVRRVGDGVAAQELLSSDEFGLIVSDVRMPRATGVDLLRWIRAERPHLLRRLLFVTGDASGSAMNAELDEAGIPVMRKPIIAADLVSQARSIVDRAST